MALHMPCIPGISTFVWSVGTWNQKLGGTGWYTVLEWGRVLHLPNNERKGPYMSTTKKTIRASRRSF